jgi:hypothetical protein
MKKFLCSLLVLSCAATAAYAATDTYKHYPLDSADTEIVENGTVSYQDGIIGKSAYFSNSSYASLPEGIMSDMTDFTISTWVKPDTVSTWARVFDFGTGTSKYMFLTLSNGSNTVFAITNNGSGSEQKITAPIAFSADKWTHIAITKSGNTAIMYADGVEVGRNESMTLSPSSLGSTDKNYLAKSQYDDPYFEGCIDDFRIYSTALSADEIVDIYGEVNNDIKSIADTNIEVTANSELSLPEYAEAEFKDNTKRDVKITWDSYNADLLKKDGTFTVEGSVIGSDVKAKAIVTVTSQSITSGLTSIAEIYKDTDENDNAKAYAKYTINNQSSETSGVVCMAAYDNGKLVGVTMDKKDNLTSGTFTVSVNLPDSEDIMVKSFLWNEHLKPLAKPVSKNYGNPYGSSFEVSEVTLTDGIFKTSQDTGKAFIMSLDVDRLLAPVAYSTGASTDKSKYYGGWEAYQYRTYSGTGISGHSLGHWMSAAATMYAATGDEEVKEKLDYVVDKLAEYQKIDGTGYIGGVEKSGLVKALSGTLNVDSFDLNGYWVPWYSFHKIYQGLVDAYNLTGNEKALTVVCGFADWAIDVTKDMSDDKFNEMLNCEYGGMNEVMAELYDITGEKKYLDLAVRFSQPSILTPLSNDIDELSGKHANTQIPKVLGAAAVYEADEDRTDYREAAEFFYDTVVNHRSYVIGGNSNYEHFGSITEEVLGTETLETCNTYNMMKLTEYLYRWNHDASYMDYYEKALFNHILASQDPNTGEKTYFMSTKPGHFKVYSDALDGNSFWCCVGSGMENPGRYTRNIYYKDGDDFYVNQFISSTVEWKEKGLTVSQTTNYPYEDTTVIKIEKGSAEAAMKIRIPSWIASAATIKINDEDAITTSKTGYYTIDRVWKEGDVITVTLPMALHTYTARDSANKVAFMYGPVVLAGDFGTESFPSSDLVNDHTSLDNYTSIDVDDLVVEDKNPETFIKLKDSKKLEFTMSVNGNDIKLIPYADLHHERYTLYWYLYGKDEEIEKDAFTIALDAATTDTVRPNEQQPEVDHNMQKNNSYSGYFDTVSRGWRDARGADGYFSYDMKVSSDAEKNYVMALYWGGDGAFSADNVSYTREFNILVDDTVIGTQTLNNNSPNNLIYAFYEIPSELTEGKDTVTVKFQPTGANKAAGGVFEIRTTTAEVKSE